MNDNIQQLKARPLWSATPTPFDDNMRISNESVERLVEHHIKLGVSGLFLLGTCGEGPWVPDYQRRAFVSRVVECSRGRLNIAVQVTDNSAARILENIECAAEDGADLAIVASPYFVHNPNADTLTALYAEVVDNSVVPIGIYDQGKHGPTAVPAPVLQEVVTDEKVIVVKDSSEDPRRRRNYLSVRQRRDDLRLFSGLEWDCVTYMEAGYDGLLLGGGIFNAHIARQIMDLCHAGQLQSAREMQQHMNQIMYDVYGGEEITCWLRGLKHLLVRMRIFETDNLYLNYSLTAECRKSIERVLDQHHDELFPWDAQ